MAAINAPILDVSDEESDHPPSDLDDTVHDYDSGSDQRLDVTIRQLCAGVDWHGSSASASSTASTEEEDDHSPPPPFRFLNLSVELQNHAYLHCLEGDCVLGIEQLDDPAHVA